MSEWLGFGQIATLDLDRLLSELAKIPNDRPSPRGTFANVIYFSKEGHDIPFLEN